MALTYGTLGVDENNTDSTTRRSFSLTFSGAADECLVVGAWKSYNGTPDIADVRSNATSLTFSLCAADGTDNGSKMAYVSPTNLSDTGTQTVDVDLDGAVYGWDGWGLPIEDVTDESPPEHTTASTGTGTAVSLTATHSVQAGTLGACGNDDAEIPTTSDTSVGTVTSSLGGGARIARVDGTSNNQLNWSFGASRAHGETCMTFQEAAAGGPTVRPPPRHNIGSQFNPINAARLNGALH